MSYYKVLERPAGTYAFRQGPADQLAGLSQTGAKGMTDIIYRKAAKKAGLTPTFKRGEAGKWDISYEQPKKKEVDINEAIKMLLGEDTTIDKTKKLPEFLMGPEGVPSTVWRPGAPGVREPTVEEKEALRPKPAIERLKEKGIETSLKAGPFTFKPTKKDKGLKPTDYKRVWDLAEKMARGALGKTTFESVSNVEIKKFIPVAQDFLKGEGIEKKETKKPIAERFNELAKEGISEDEAYQKLLAEGY